MPAFRVVPKITFENTVMFSAQLRQSLKIPVGVPAYEPIRLNFGEMSKKEPSKVPAPAGLTVSEVDVEAPGVSRASSGSGASQWTFGGGDIILNIQISIYIIDKFASVPKLLKLIMEHEYIHVSDNLTLAKDITKKIQDDSILKPWLDGESWTGSAFFDRIRTIWGTEAKRLGNKLDSGPSYDKHKREIADLMPR